MSSFGCHIAKRKSDIIFVWKLVKMEFQVTKTTKDKPLLICNDYTYVIDRRRNDKITPTLLCPSRLPYPYTDFPWSAAISYTNLPLYWPCTGQCRAKCRVVERKRSAFKRGYGCHGMLAPSGSEARSPWHLWSGFNSLLLRFTTLDCDRHCPASPCTACVRGL